MQKRAIIVGANGQDGRLLNSHLASLGYELFCISKENFDIFNPNTVSKLVQSFQPNELYYLAAFNFSSEISHTNQSDVLKKSFDISVIGLGFFLQSLVDHKVECKVFNASSSLIYQPTESGVLNEESTILPDSIYANAKVSAMNLCDFYSRQFGIQTFNGILFNHESKLRGDRYLSKKIVKAAVEALKDPSKRLTLQSLVSIVDWGAAEDYVKAMQLLLDSEATSGDYIFATGEPHTVEDFARIAFNSVNLNFKDFVKIDSSILTRKPEKRIGDSTKLANATGWKRDFSFEQMIINMVKYELYAE